MTLLSKDISWMFVPPRAFQKEVFERTSLYLGHRNMYHFHTGRIWSTVHKCTDISELFLYILKQNVHTGNSGFAFCDSSERYALEISFNMNLSQLCYSADVQRNLRRPYVLQFSQRSM